MSSFKLRKNTGGSVLRGTDNATLRSIDGVIYFVTLVATSTLLTTLKPLTLINRLINNLVNSNFLIYSTKTLSKSSSFSAVVLTQSLRFLTLSILNSLSANISKFITSYQDIAEAFTAIVLRRTNKYLSLNFDTSALILQKSLSINRSLSLILNPQTYRLTSITKSLTNSFSLQFSRQIYKIIDRIVTFSITFFYVSYRLISLNIQSSFASTVNKNVYKTIVLLMQRIYFVEYISGGLSSTITFDDSIDASTGSTPIDANPASTTVLSKNPLKTLPITQSSLTLLITPFTKFVQLTVAVMTAFNSNFNKAIVKTIALSVPYTTRATKAVTRAFDLASTFLSDLNQAAAITFYQTLNVDFTSYVNLNKIVSQTLNASFTFIINIQKRTNHYVIATVTITITYFKTINKTVNSLITQTFNISSHIYFSRSLLSSLQPSYNRFVLKTFGASSSFTSVINKTISRLLTSTTPLTSSIHKLINLNIKSTASANIFINKAISILINFNITDVTSFAVSVTKAFEASYTASVTSFKAVSIKIGALSSQTAQLITQSSRYVTLAIINAFNSNITRTINKFINNILVNTTTLSKNVLKNLDSTLFVTLNLLLQRLNFIGLSILSLLNSNINFAVSQKININVELISLIRKRAQLLVSTTFNIVLDILYSFPVYLYASVTIAPDISRKINAYRSINTSFTSSFRKAIASTISNLILTLNSNTLFISFRFVSIALTSLFSSTATKKTTRFMTADLSMNAFLSNAISVLLNITINNNIILLTQSLRFVRFTLTEAFIPSNFKFSITRSFELINEMVVLKFKKIVFTQLMTSLESVLQLQIIVSKTFVIMNTYIVTKTLSIDKFIQNTYTMLTNLATQSLRFATLAIISGFNVSKQIIITTTLYLNSNLQTIRTILINTFLRSSSGLIITIIKDTKVTLYAIANVALSISYSLSISLRKTLNLSTTLVTQSLRFISLSIINLFSTSNVLKIFITKNIESSHWVQFNKVTNVTLKTGVELIISTIQAMAIYLNSTVVLASTLLTRSLRFVTLAIINSYDALRQATITTTLNGFSVFQTIKTILIQTSLRLSTEFLSSLKKNIRVQLYATANFIAVFVHSIIISIQTVLTLSITMSTRSLRFVTLAIVNLFEVAKIAYISRILRVNFTSISRVSKILERTLTISSILFTRRSHTLYSVLTSFAVNKSTPGSQGSGQITQRKPGGSARKRNTTNNGSTQFRRGDTDDLQ